ERRANDGRSAAISATASAVSMSDGHFDAARGALLRGGAAATASARAICGSAGLRFWRHVVYCAQDWRAAAPFGSSYTKSPRSALFSHITAPTPGRSALLQPKRS